MSNIRFYSACDPQTGERDTLLVHYKGIYYPFCLESGKQVAIDRFTKDPESVRGFGGREVLSFTLHVEIT